jgi:hypothetical protein
MKKINLLMTAIAIFGFATISMAQNQLGWGTYYTATQEVWPFGEDLAKSCITDASGNVYMVGYTSSAAGSNLLATSGAHQSLHAGGPTSNGSGSFDAYLVKFNSSGVRQWATYYGGSGNDFGFSCATDASGNVFMIGITSSTSGIATAGAHETAVNNGFLVKFNSSGVRQWGTYFGGNGKHCTTDASGNIYIVGGTDLTLGIATAGAHQTMLSGSGDAFLVKFNSSGVKQWGTYFGGISADDGNSCTIDALGNIYMTGATFSSSGIATAGAHQTANAGYTDAFLVKFNSSGVRQWGTYYGGVGPDDGFSCTTDASGNVYMTGQAQQQMAASGIATPGSHQSAYGGGYNDAFLVKFDSNGFRQWGTYYGGSLGDSGNSCTIDAFGNIYMTGWTQSSTGIATAGAFKIVISGPNDVYLVKFNSSGVRQSGTYYGGGDIDIASSCATDASGNIYMTGHTQSNSGIATPGAHQTVDGGVGNSYNDAFLVKFNGISVGINETVNEKSFTVYPNPTQSTVNLKADGKLIGAVYTIYDNTGNVVLSGTINTENTSIELGNLSAGIYLFSVGENVKQTFKVIKE